MSFDPSRVFPRNLRNLRQAQHTVTEHSTLGEQTGLRRQLRTVYYSWNQLFPANKSLTILFSQIVCHSELDSDTFERAYLQNNHLQVYVMKPPRRPANTLGETMLKSITTFKSSRKFSLLSRSQVKQVLLFIQTTVLGQRQELSEPLTEGSTVPGGWQ